VNQPGRYLVPAAIFILAVYFLVQVQDVLLPFVLAATLAYLLNPMVRFFEVRGIRHRPAALFVFMMTVAALISVVYVTGSLASEQVSRMATDLPLLVQRFRATFINGSFVGEHFPYLRNFIGTSDLRDIEMGRLSGRIWEKTSMLAWHVIPLVELTFLVPFLAFLFMLDGSALRDTLLELAPPRYVEVLLSVLVEIDNSLGAYVRGLCLESAAIGILAGIGFSLIGLHYTVPIALWVAATSMIPLVGPISAGLAGCIVAFVQWGTFAGVAKVVLITIGIRFVDDWFLQPLILRRAVHIHPAFTVFALMAGAALCGFWGLLFAVPVVCMAKVLLGVVWQWYRAEYEVLVFDPAPEVTHIPLI